MRKLLTMCLLLICFSAAAQEAFRYDYNYIVLKNKEGVLVAGRKSNSYVFNYNENNDVMAFLSDGTRELYRKISGVEEGETDRGVSYQFFEVVTNQGEVLGLCLLDNGDLIVMHDGGVMRLTPSIEGENVTLIE